MERFDVVENLPLADVLPGVGGRVSLTHRGRIHVLRAYPERILDDSEFERLKGYAKEFVDGSRYTDVWLFTLDRGAWHYPARDLGL